jgi:alpha-beta hydrolase superfamily lysophospholipase
LKKVKILLFFFLLPEGKKMKEKLMIFKNKKGEKLFGILTLPERKGEFPAVIMVHGFAKTKSERKFVELARELAKNKIASLRFDFSGCGDSEGKFEEMGILKQVEELKAAYERLIKEKAIDKNRIGIFAHSLGTVIAALFQKKYQKAKCLVLAAPAFDQESLIKKWYTQDQIKEWRKKGYLDTPKFRIGLGYLEEARNYTEILAEIKVPTLIVHGKEDEDIPENFAKEAFQKLGAKEKKLELVKGADHHFESYLSRQKLIALSKNWFKKYL